MCAHTIGVLRAQKQDETEFDEVGVEVVTRFEAGEPLVVTVLSIMGKDLVIGVSRDVD